LWPRRKRNPVPTGALLLRGFPEEFAAAFRADVTPDASVFNGRAVGPAALQVFCGATRRMYDSIALID
jgi:hypothetical protein